MTTPQRAIPGVPLSADVSGQLLMRRYQHGQQSIAARAAIAIQRLWMRIIDPAHFSDGWGTLGPLVDGIISSHYSAAAADAADYYANSRVVSGFKHIGVPGLEPDMAYIHHVADAMGPGQFFGFLPDHGEQNASSMAADALRGASTRMVMMGGRDTVTSAVRIDSAATGWERVIEPGACGFCAMLAGRGAVYKEDTVRFRAHDHCHCIARAVFRGQESINDDLSSEWGRVTAGHSGRAAVREWNKYWESRNGGYEGKTALAAAGPSPAAVEQESVRRAALPH